MYSKLLNKFGKISIIIGGSTNQIRNIMLSKAKIKKLRYHISEGNYLIGYLIMFPNLPIEIEYLIFKFYFSMNVLKEITWQETIWEEPSDTLCLLTKDHGCFQSSHTDLEFMFCDYYPHTSFFRDLLRPDYLEKLPTCEDCIWEKFGKCQREKREKSIVNRIITVV